MSQKLTIGILVFLLILSGSIAYYSYTLNQQVSSLRAQLVAFQTEQANQSQTLSRELITLREETRTMVGNLEDKLEKGVKENLARIGSLENKIDENSVKINTLEDEIKDVNTLSQSVLDANQVYQRASQATVRISNGTRTVGSGIIFDNEARVVTAQHVVDNLTQVYVIMSDGRTAKATVTGGSVYSDVAVLTLKDKLAVAPPRFGDSASVKIGEPVAAIGNPFELTNTITAGIVSQINRFAEIKYDGKSRWVANLIQFDAAANFGSSGGPLVNAKGEIIGMVIARIGPEEGDGIYYAVSANKLKRVADALIAQGTFAYPWLGIAITNLTPQIAQNKALETINGILVGEVFAGGPAANAGIKAEDIIVAIDGIMLRNVAELVSYLGEHKSPGESTTLTLLRGTAKLELAMKIGKRA